MRRTPASPEPPGTLPLKGLRIGVLREYMDKKLFTPADAESIDIVEKALPELKKLGAEIVDPGAGGALFQSCLAKYDPHVHQAKFIKQHKQLFPFDDKGKPQGDHVALLVELFFDQSKFPDGPSIRGLGPAQTLGDRKYVLNRYLRERGDKNIQSIDDLIAKSNFYTPGVGLPGQEADAGHAQRGNDARCGRPPAAALRRAADRHAVPGAARARCRHLSHRQRAGARSSARRTSPP